MPPKTTHSPIERSWLAVIGGVMLGGVLFHLATSTPINVAACLPDPGGIVPPPKPCELNRHPSSNRSNQLHECTIPLSQLELGNDQWQKHADAIHAASIAEQRAAGKKVLTSQPFVVNIGAHDGKSMNDPCAHWITAQNGRGLAVEGDASPLRTRALRSNVLSADVAIHMGFVTPDNIEAVLEKAHTPRDLLVLKVDIDSYDVDVTVKVLELGYRPKIMVLEHNEKFPPGFKFRVRHSPTAQWRWAYDHVMGNSGTAWQEELDRFPEYHLMGLAFNQLVYAHNTVIDVGKSTPRVTLDCAYEQGYVQLPWSKVADEGGKPEYNRNVAHWFDKTRYPDVRLHSMQQYVASSETRAEVGPDYPIELEYIGPVHQDYHPCHCCRGKISWRH